MNEWLAWWSKPETCACVVWLQLTPECIQLQRSVKGHPTGEATISFPTRADAERAFHDKSHHNMGSRYIELFMVWVLHINIGMICVLTCH